MGYVCYSDFLARSMPDERDMRILFKAVVNVAHNSESKEDISVNMENIEYDREKGSIRFLKSGGRGKGFYNEIGELAGFLASRLRYGDEQAYGLILSIRDAFEKDGIRGISSAIAADGGGGEERSRFSASDLAFFAAIAVLQVLFYKITGMRFFK